MDMRHEGGEETPGGVGTERTRTRVRRGLSGALGRLQQFVGWLVWTVSRSLRWLAGSTAGKVRLALRIVLEPLTGRRSMRRFVEAELEIQKTELMQKFFLAYRDEERGASVTLLRDFDRINQLISGKHYQGWNEETIVAVFQWKDRDVRRYLGWSDEEIAAYRSVWGYGPMPGMSPFSPPGFVAPEETTEDAAGRTGSGDEGTAPTGEKTPTTGGTGPSAPVLTEPSETWEAASPRIPEGSHAQESTAPITVFPWALSALEYLIDAQFRIDRESTFYNPSAALGSLYAAQRQLLVGEAQIDDASVLQSARAVFHESETLSKSWRRRAIRDYLGDGERLKTNVELSELLDASEILHDHYLERYQQAETLRINVLTFIALTIASIGVIVGWFPIRPDVALGIEDTILVLVFGAVGASISGIRAIETEPESLHSMTRILGYWLPIIRIVIGSVSAFLVVVFTTVGGAPGLLDSPVVLGIAFASGFSERLLLRSVRSFEGVSTSAGITK